jgi:DNA mismatch repair protein MutS
LFEALVGSLKAHGEDIRDAGQALSTLDVLLGFVEVADAFGWVKPEVDQTASLEIRAGKHPVIASLLQGRFVANDVSFGDERGRVLILTGPNMGGKSTYLRQVALISIMAQVGSYVPAEYARLGVVDQVFARIGATDNLAEGESTFMVEMREMAQILRCATRQSLLVIDEVGRGTATADGVSIARAIVEWIVEHIDARTLFATHFHELTALSETTGLVSNISVTSIEQGNEVVFTHHIAEGPADRSYGVEVARLAGLPENLLSRAAELLAQAGSATPRLDEQESEVLKVSKGGLSPARSKESAQLGLFHEVGTEGGNRIELEMLQLLRARLAAIDVNQTTPLEALKILSELKSEF